MTDLLQYISSGAWIAVLAATLFEIAPIKVNPWGWLFKKIGKALNGEVSDKVDRLQKDLTALEKRENEREAKYCRTRILRFGDECVHGQLHTKEHFDQILEDITQYEQYCRENPQFPNSQAVMTIQRIKDIYQQCLQTGSFL